MLDFSHGLRLIKTAIKLGENIISIYFDILIEKKLFFSIKY